MSDLQQFAEEYQNARVKFVQGVAEVTTRPQSIEVVNNTSLIQLLKLLILDNVPSIQQTAALALGRLANYSKDLAEAVVGNEILPQLVYSLSDQNCYYKQAAAFVLRAVAKHSPELAQAVIDSNALETLVPCLEDVDPKVKEAAAWAIGYIAQHTPGLAQNVVDAGAVPLLVLCIQESEITLKRICASSISDICKHSPELAQAVVDAGAVTYLVSLIQHPDAKLKRQVCSALSHIAKHSVDLAEVVVKAKIFPNILHCLKDNDTIVRKNAAMCIREIAKHTPELAKLIVNSGGAAALVDFVAEAHGNNKLPGIMAIGYIAAFSETLALVVIESKGIAPLKEALVSESEDHIKAACAWTLGQIGRHTPDHAAALIEGDLLRHLLACMVHEESSEDLRTKAKRSLKAVFANAEHALQPLLKDSPEMMQKYVLQLFAEVLPQDVEAQRASVQSDSHQVMSKSASAPTRLLGSAPRKETHSENVHLTAVHTMNFNGQYSVETEKGKLYLLNTHEGMYENASSQAVSRQLRAIETKQNTTTGLAYRPHNDKLLASSIDSIDQTLQMVVSSLSDAQQEAENLPYANISAHLLRSMEPTAVQQQFSGKSSGNGENPLRQELDNADDGTSGANSYNKGFLFGGNSNSRAHTSGGNHMVVDKNALLLAHKPSVKTDLFDHLPHKPVIPLRIEPKDVVTAEEDMAAIRDKFKHLADTAVRKITHEVGITRNGKNSISIEERARRIYSPSKSAMKMSRVKTSEPKVSRSTSDLNQTGVFAAFRNSNGEESFHRAAEGGNNNFNELFEGTGGTETDENMQTVAWNKPSYETDSPPESPGNIYGLRLETLDFDEADLFENFKPIFDLPVRDPSGATTVDINNGLQQTFSPDKSKPLPKLKVEMMQSIDIIM